MTIVRDVYYPLPPSVHEAYPHFPKYVLLCYSQEEQRNSAASPLTISFVYEKTTPPLSNSYTNLNAESMGEENESNSDDQRPSNPTDSHFILRKNNHKIRRSITLPSCINLVETFDLPIKEAAKTLRLCLSYLKKNARKYGIKRWPCRLINAAQHYHTQTNESKRYVIFKNTLSKTSSYFSKSLVLQMTMVRWNIPSKHTPLTVQD